MSDEEGITEILHDEGGLAQNPADPGGITNYGITVPAWTDFLRDMTGNPRAQAVPEDVRTLTESNAREFYRWLARSSGISRLANEDVRYCVLDAVVNMGRKPGIKLLQRALGIVDDGMIGGATVAAVPYRDGKMLCRLVCVEQMLFYGRLASGDLTDADRDGIPDRLEFLPGWLNRLARKMRRYA